MKNIEKINILLNEIANQTNQATSKEQAQSMNLDKYLFIEYASVYGGYRIVNVGVKNGAHYGALNGSGTENRLNAPKMIDKLSNILNGMQINKQFNAK